MISPYLPTPPPRVSPYLGLLNGGNPATNYYLLVQPQVRRGIDNTIIGQTTSADALSRVDPRTATEAADLSFVPVLPQSGHGAGFGVTTPYFQFPTRGRTYIPYNGQTPVPLPPANRQEILTGGSDRFGSLATSATEGVGRVKRHSPGRQRQKATVR